MMGITGSSAMGSTLSFRAALCYWKTILERIECEKVTLSLEEDEEEEACDLERVNLCDP